MTSSEHMTWLVDRDICNGLVQHSWINASWFQCWQAVSGFMFALRDLQAKPKAKYPQHSFRLM